MKLLCATIKLDREVAPCGAAHFDYLPYGRYVNTLQNFNLVPNGTYIRQKKFPKLSHLFTIYNVISSKAFLLKK